MMFTVTSAIFAEAVLSFLGLLDLRMSWGIMIHTANAGGYLLGGTKYWWLVIPGRSFHFAPLQRLLPRGTGARRSRKSAIEPPR